MSPVSCFLSPGLGLFLHASAVVIEDRAIMFLGHSTAGKSTMARLLGEVAPVLADDSVYAFRGESGEWRVVDGGFRVQDGGLSEWQASVRQRTQKGSVRVGACFRLQKAAKTRLESLDPWQLARYLMDAAMEIDVQRKGGSSRAPSKNGIHNILHDNKMRKNWFSLVSNMARDVPGGHLYFSRHENSACLAKNIELFCAKPSAGGSILPFFHESGPKS
jgi:hypothetical protein